MSSQIDFFSDDLNDFNENLELFNLPVESPELSKMALRHYQEIIDGYDEELELDLEFNSDFNVNARLIREESEDFHILKQERRTYFRELFRMQGELVKLQDYVVKTGQKIVILFEGRDAAGCVVWQRCLHPMIESGHSGIFSVMYPICLLQVKLFYLIVVGITVLGLSMLWGFAHQNSMKNFLELFLNLKKC
jgi:Polyphosphate kinase 2 (PPK2)